MFLDRISNSDDLTTPKNFKNYIDNQQLNYYNKISYNLKGDLNGRMESMSNMAKI